MTGFIIFAIVLTLGYVLYYAAIITTDLAAQKKAETSEEETVDIGTGSDDVDEFATQHVIENPMTGGFDFMVPEKKEEDAPNEIAEAEEYAAETNDPDEVSSETENETSNQNGHEEDPNSDSAEPVQSEEFEMLEESTDDVEGINTFTFSDEEPAPEKVAFKEEEAFDPSLRQTHFDVKTVYEPTASPEVSNHANMVNASMESITVKGNVMISADLRDTMHNHNKVPTNLELTDEWTRY